jgi:DNA-binding MarR family transcriptional regulator
MTTRSTRATQALDADGRAAGVSLGALEHLVGFHLARATVSTSEHFERHIGTRMKLNKVEFSLLMLVMANSGISPKRLARALAIASPTLTLLLDRLAQRGLILRERNAADGRSQHVALTDKGRKLAHEAAAAADEMERELHSRLTRAEHAMLIELLHKLAPA